MARKHNTKHYRSPSGYAAKVARQGRGSVLMAFIDSKGRKHASPSFIKTGEK